MKIVKLKQPTAVKEGAAPAAQSVLRHPIEGPLTVSDDEAKRLEENNLLDGDPEDVPEDDDLAGADDDGLDAMTGADLGILVTKEGVPLNGATKKADIVKAIRAHRAPAA